MIYVINITLLFYHFVLCKFLYKKGFKMKMTIRDIAGYLGINTKTIYNWKKDRPNLYKTVMLGLKSQEIIEKMQENIDELKSLEEGSKTNKK